MLGGWAVWALSVCLHMPFTRSTALLVTAFFAVCLWIVRLGAAARGMKSSASAAGRLKSGSAATGREKSGSAAIGNRKPDRSAIGCPVNIRLIVVEELMFLAVLILWTYFIGFHPDVTGTEKPMDYGFMAALDRSTAMPAKDIWYGTDPINYYYGGQYFSVYFAKLAFTEVKYAYNMMRALIAALVFVMPFSMVRQLLLRAGTHNDNFASSDTGRKNRNKAEANESSHDGTTETSESGHDGTAGASATGYGGTAVKNRSRVIAASGGLLASAAVACAGNFHYVLYGLFGKLFRPSGWQDYWFPESTRFIGHNPPTDDACIHEFPSYSFVLGDMHAHMINLIFVLLFLGILTAWMLEIAANREKRVLKASGRETAPGKAAERKSVSGKASVRISAAGIRKVLSPHLLVLAAMTGMFKWTNYWDFIIYLTVLLMGMGILLIRDVRRGASLKQELILFVVRLVLIWLVGKIAAYPFTAGFEMMVSEVAIAKSHTAFYQFMILWGLPVVTFLLYVIWLFRRWRHGGQGLSEKVMSESASLPEVTSSRKKKILQGEIPVPYLIAFLFGLCALGLILIPELVYVKDIYEEGFSRSNTMFKLTYQAFVMFGLFFGFALPEMLLNRFGRSRSVSELPEVRPVQIAAGVLTVLLLLTVGYLPYSIKCWFGNVLDPSGFLGMDATAFLEDVYPEDAAAIRWLDANVEGQPVVLETWGDSYSEDCRVSAFTGIPTVQGWYVHEWLWRMDLDKINERVDDVNAIFMTTSDPADLANTREMLRKYGVEYIFVGSCERAKYPTMDEDTLKMLGTVVYEDENSGTFIVRVE